MKVEREHVCLADMLEAAQDAIEFTREVDVAQFLEDRMRSHAVVRALEILGEAAKGVSEETRRSHPEIAWKRISGLRDKLIHDYGNVDLMRVWNIVGEDLPALIPALRGLLAKKGIR